MHDMAELWRHCRQIATSQRSW